MKKWTGSTSGDFGVAGNWQDFSGGAWIAAVAAPADGDDLQIFEGRDIDSGLNQAGVNLASLRISGNVGIGTPGSPLIIGVSDGSDAYCLYQGRADCYLSAGTDNIDKLIADAPGPGTLYLSGGTVTALECTQRGFVEVAAACVVTNFYTAGAGARILANATAIANATIEAGSVYTERTLTVADLAERASLTTSETAGIGTEITVSGKFTHDSSGTVQKIVRRMPGRAMAGERFNFTVVDSVEPPTAAGGSDPQAAFSNATVVVTRTNSAEYQAALPLN